MSGYEYDIFFSYKRDVQSKKWHSKVAEKIEFWLRKELNQQKINLFIDKEDIEIGERWKMKIADGLKRSKCLVALLSPDYFNSPWCVSEWKTFLAREKMLEQLGIESRGLIVPAIYHDGEHFPAEAKDIQAVDFSDYNSTMDFFWHSEDGYIFERDKLKTFSKEIAKTVQRAPAYREDFPIVVVESTDIRPRAPIRRIA
jgi:hypothetical protein